MGDRLRLAAEHGLPTFANDDASDVTRADESLTPDFFERLKEVANKVVDFNTNAFAGLSELSVGERYFATANDGDRIVEAWAENFMTLCKSANAELKKKVSLELSRRVMEGRPKAAYHGAPGTDFQCRCVAMPYVPEYGDDYEREREKGPVQGVTQGAHADTPTIPG